MLGLSRVVAGREVQNPWVEALLDALIIFFFVFLSSLTQTGFPITVEALQAAGLAGALAFFASIAAWRKISLPSNKPVEGGNDG